MATAAPVRKTNMDTGEVIELRGNQWVPVTPGLDTSAPGVGLLPRGRSTEDLTSGERQAEANYWAKSRTGEDPRVGAAMRGRQTALRAEGLLNKQSEQGQGTGGLYGFPLIGPAMSYFDPELKELDAIQAETARQKRQPGEGATSDFDAKQFMVQTYGRDKPLETNRNLIRAQRIADDMTLQNREFKEWYVDRFGSTNGAQEAWRAYAEANTIFDPRSEATGEPVLNPHRQNWREYFGSVRGAQDNRRTGAETDARASRQPQQRPGDRAEKALGAEGRAGYEALFKSGQIDQKQPWGAYKNPYVVRDEAAAEALAKRLGKPVYVVINGRRAQVR